MALTATVALNTNDADAVDVTVFALITPAAFPSSDLMAVLAGNAYAGLGSVLSHRKPKVLPARSGQHTFSPISVHLSRGGNGNMGYAL